MSREKSVWFAEEILLDAKFINFQLETGELSAVEEMLRAEAQLSRDSETGRFRPKKASEYTLRLIAEVLHIMKLDIETPSYNLLTLAVAEQCLRLIRSCAASGMKIQTYISKDLSILDDMLSIFTEYQHPSEEILNEEISKKFDSCMVVLTQTLGNLVVNNPFNQTIIWDKFGSNILNALIGQNEKLASCAAMIVYNILLGQPNVLPDDVLLLNALAYMYSDGNSEFPHLIIEYLIGVENTYIEKLYNRLEPDTRLLILNLAYNILVSVETQDINVSVNFIKFIAHEFKVKSDCILKTVDKYVNSIEPQEVVYLLDIIGTASSMDTYMDCLQRDASLFINCSFLLHSIHKLGKQEDNFFSSIHKLYQLAGKNIPENIGEGVKITEESPSQEQSLPAEDMGTVKKCDSADMLHGNETVSECTESESSEQYFECTDQPPFTDKIESITNMESLQNQIDFVENKSQESLPVNIIPAIADSLIGINFTRQTSVDRKVSDSCKIDEGLIKVAFAKNIKPDVTPMGIMGVDPTLCSVILPGSGKVDSIDKIMSRKVSLDHKIDILDEMEPPLITDSPEEAKPVDAIENAPINQSTIADANIMRKDSLGMQINTAMPSSTYTDGRMSRQQSVEHAVEASETVIREMTSEINSPDSSNTDSQFIEQPVINVQRMESVPEVNPGILSNIEPPIPVLPNIEAEPPAPVIVSPKGPTEPIPVKKSQNVSTEFDLSEQLQKILGISADKAMRADSLDLSKDVHSVQNTHQKVEIQPILSQSVNLQPTQIAEQTPPVQKTQKIRMNIPNVKIDSPDSHKTKLGAFDSTGPKRLTSVVESVEQHVAFGFKATLIRTLGNLCWKNGINKRQVRDLDLIPLFLDCCNIDARNPLIMQWVILAVRNFCENCPENQEVISSLSLREPVDNELLKEMGLTMRKDSATQGIRVVPLNSKQ